MYDVGKSFLELVGGGVAAGSDAVVDGSKVGGALLKLMSMSGEEVFSGKQLSEVWNKEGSLCEIKRKCGLHTMHHVKRGVAC